MPNKKDEWGNIELPGLTDEELYKKDWSKVRDSATLVSSEEWKLKHKQGIEQRQQSEWAKNVRQATKTKNLNPVNRQRHLEGIAKRNASPEFAQKLIDNGLKKRKPIQVPWGLFDSRKSAVAEGLAQGITNALGKIQRGLLNNPKEYYYVTKR